MKKRVREREKRIIRSEREGEKRRVEKKGIKIIWIQKKTFKVKR